MHLLYGNGVTKNFMAILEAEIDRAGRSVARLAALALFVALLGVPFQLGFIVPGMAAAAAALMIGGGAGFTYGRLVTTKRYNESLIGNWNRWMRHSVQSMTVRECYRKVSRLAPRPSLWRTVAITVGIVAIHLLLALALLNGAGAIPSLFVFGLDAALLGLLIGRRVAERAWTKHFLQSVNDLLREGTIGVWGVY